jgi:hypothetical protein
VGRLEGWGRSRLYRVWCPGQFWGEGERGVKNEALASHWSLPSTPLSWLLTAPLWTQVSAHHLVSTQTTPVPGNPGPSRKGPVITGSLGESL